MRFFASANIAEFSEQTVYLPGYKYIRESIDTLRPFKIENFSLLQMNHSFHIWPHYPKKVGAALGEEAAPVCNLSILIFIPFAYL